MMETRDPIERLRHYLPIEFKDYETGKTVRTEFPSEAFTHDVLREIIAELEAQYMKLPVDADGVPIRPGDKMQMALGESAEAVAVDSERWFYDQSCLADDGDEYDYEWAASTRHVNHDTVESLVEEIVDKAIYLANSKHMFDMGDFAEYAERIREAVQDEG